jgi:hypothetical protein
MRGPVRAVDRMVHVSPLHLLVLGEGLRIVCFKNDKRCRRNGLVDNKLLVPTIHEYSPPDRPVLISMPEFP